MLLKIFFFFFLFFDKVVYDFVKLVKNFFFLKKVIMVIKKKFAAILERERCHVTCYWNINMTSYFRAGSCNLEMLIPWGVQHLVRRYMNFCAEYVLISCAHLISYTPKVVCFRVQIGVDYTGLPLISKTNCWHWLYVSTDSSRQFPVYSLV